MRHGEDRPPLARRCPPRSSPWASRKAEGTQTRESEAMERLFVWYEVPSAHLVQGCQGGGGPMGANSLACVGPRLWREAQASSLVSVTCGL